MRLPLQKDGGQDLLEYAILAGLIAVIAYASVETVGNTINTVFWKYIADFPL
jgi:Flp pilus assembly pilin Flp